MIDSLFFPTFFTSPSISLLGSSAHLFLPTLPSPLPSPLPPPPTSPISSSPFLTLLGSMNPKLMARVYFDNGSAQLNEREPLWPRSNIPSDGSPYTVEQYPFIWLVVCAYVFSSLNILVAVLCLIFNFVFRNRKSVIIHELINRVLMKGVIWLLRALKWCYRQCSILDVYLQDCLVFFFCIFYSV